ncbi:phospholipase D-like domain-containing protein [Puniceicoccus vermicola]|uniref:PLDc N-terminal domain-containing protein n=1 Tax=Puniceicoccus vermicola TaxID=388746 RepID=A0A7X1AVW6_9BACT|nr:phospholipase D-like domain-containing protein [Puniceicoccus vermicola]MBC2600744.1 PLDc N-terminal domain-containing protein [Puniceicoccus vermicola]
MFLEHLAMLDSLHALWKDLSEPFFNGISILIGFTYAHVLTWLGFFLGIMIIGRMLNEKRTPSNIFAWAFAVLFMPLIGVPLYFLLGGRKSRGLVERKKKVMEDSRYLAGEDVTAEELKRLRKTEGNSCQLLPDATATYNAIMNGIEESESCIHIMTYILTKDEAGMPIIEALIRKAKEGVKVRLLLDAFGCFANGGKWVEELKEAGGEVARFMPLLPLHSHSSANLRNHRKLAIFDHRRAITGGQNIDMRFMGPRITEDTFLDFSIDVEGPVLRHLNFIFLNDWIFASRQKANRFSEIFSLDFPQAGDRSLEIIESGPEVSTDALYERILELIQDCRDTITIVTPYFVPDEVLFRSLIVKSHAGRKVRLIIPRHSNQKLVDVARFHYLRQLQGAGVDVQFFMPGMIHAKLILIDGKIALSGSANFDMRSLFVNFEMGIVHTDPGDYAAFADWVRAIEKDCQPMGEVVMPEGKGRRFIEDFAHLVGPLL